MRRVIGKQSVMDRKHLGIFMFLYNMPDVEAMLFSATMLKSKARKTKQNKNIKRRTCAAEKAETECRIYTFYQSLSQVSELESKQLSRL